MKTCIMLVGSELLNGMMLDTNSIYIAEELNKYGMNISNKIVVGDKIEDIVQALSYAKKNNDLIIISGGLGPTIDDLTRDAISKFCDKELILNEDEYKKIEEKFEKYGIKIPESNKRQVMFPEGSIIIDNDKGAAPAFFVDGIVAFPGVPYELKEAFPKFLDFYVKKYNLKNKLFIKDLLFWGIPESQLEDKLIDIIKEEKDVFVEFLVKDYGIIVRLNSEQDCIEKLEQLRSKIYERVSEYIFGEDEERLEQIVIDELRKKDYKLSLAESCTGGMVSSILVGVPGVSDVYTEGFVVYSNDAKINTLNVEKSILQTYGAVSSETVMQLLENLKTKVGIAISGVAGPGGGTESKPIGTVYIGIKVEKTYIVEEFLFTGDRERIRKRASYTALNMLRKELKNKN